MKKKFEIQTYFQKNSNSRSLNYILGTELNYEKIRLKCSSIDLAPPTYLHTNIFPLTVALMIIEIKTTTKVWPQQQQYQQTTLSQRFIHVFLLVMEHLAKLNAFELHKLVMQKIKASVPVNSKTDADVIKENHRFLWEEDVQEIATWEQKLARKYYSKVR